MRNKILYILFACTISQICFADEIKYPVLSFDSPKDATLPKNFRTTKDPFKVRDVHKPGPSVNTPTRKGFDSLMASASGQISETTLKNILPKMQGDIYIVDVRQESHGFLNGEPIGWYGYRNYQNRDKTPDQVLKIENSLLAGIAKKKKVTVSYIEEKVNGTVLKTLEKRVPVEKVERVDEFWKRQNLKFKRFFVTDHRRPSPEQVDQFIKFVDSLPQGTWTHFQCRAGRGRSSTFLIMYDILRNAKKVSLNDMIRRHHFIGGINFRAHRVTPRWKSRATIRRRNFIKRFYEYASSSKGYGKVSYSQWHEEHGRIITTRSWDVKG